VGTRTIEQLRRGARLHSLAYAAHLAKNPNRQYDVAWERLCYRRSDARGARGAVAFSSRGLVGVFFEETSPRAPANLKKGAYKLEDHFKGIPDVLMRLARDEALDAMVVALGAKMIPVVTAAFWSDPTGALVGVRPWPRLNEDGASLVEAEMDKAEKAILAWAERYALSADQATMLKTVWTKKMKPAQAAAKLTLSADERAALGIIPNQATRELLAGAGIALD